MRKLARSVAHANMARLGYTGVNKKRVGESFFSRNWRKFVKVGK